MAALMCAAMSGVHPPKRGERNQTPEASCDRKITWHSILRHELNCNALGIESREIARRR